MSLALPPARYIVLLPLPDTVAAHLDGWAEEAQGASIPPFGWHVTLAPAFVPHVSEAVLVAAIEHSLATMPSFRAVMTAARIVPDKTRPDYAAVFLECEDVAVDGCGAIVDLQSKVATALTALVTDQFPALSAAPFRPHVTLALSVSEQEANRLARFARSRKLGADFVCDCIWLLRLETRSDATAQPWRHAFRLDLSSATQP